jgi:hypothetical protein
MLLRAKSTSKKEEQGNLERREPTSKFQLIHTGYVTAEQGSSTKFVLTSVFWKKYSAKKLFKKRKRETGT